MLTIIGARTGESDERLITSALKNVSAVNVSCAVVHHGLTYGDCHQKAFTYLMNEQTKNPSVVD